MPCPPASPRECAGADREASAGVRLTLLVSRFLLPQEGRSCLHMSQGSPSLRLLLFRCVWSMLGQKQGLTGPLNGLSDLHTQCENSGGTSHHRLLCGASFSHSNQVFLSGVAQGPGLLPSVAPASSACDPGQPCRLPPAVPCSMCLHRQGGLCHLLALQPQLPLLAPPR